MPAPTGLPDLLAHGRLARVVAEIKQRAEVARTEAVTGRYEDQTRAVNGDIGSVQLIQKAADDAKAYQTTLALAANRAARTQTVLEKLTTESSVLATDALSFLGRGDHDALISAAASARGALFDVFAALNTTGGDRALFSGDAVDRAPLAAVETLLADVAAIIAGAPDAASAEAALDVYFNDPAGGFQTTIYQGGAGQAPSVEIAPGVRVNASVKADAQPIKDLIRSLATLAQYPAAPGGAASERDALATAAAERALVAEEALVQLRAVIGVAEARIAGSIARYEEEERVLTNLVNSKIARDPFEAASQLQQYESQLEASFLVAARVSRLSLADFLR